MILAEGSKPPEGPTGRFYALKKSDGRFGGERCLIYWPAEGASDRQAHIVTVDRGSWIDGIRD